MLYQISIGAVHSELIRGDRVWRYNTYYGVTDGSSFPPQSDIYVMFMGSEWINGKEYSLLVTGYPDPSGHLENTGTVSFYGMNFQRCLIDEIASDVSVRPIFLMREQDGKVYIYNDKELRYTTPVHYKDIHFDLSMQPEGYPEKLLLYDFNANPGEVHKSLFYNREGVPVVCDATIKGWKTYAGLVAQERELSSGEMDYSIIDYASPICGNYLFFMAGMCVSAYGGYPESCFVSYVDSRGDLYWNDVYNWKYRLVGKRESAQDITFETYSVSDNNKQHIVDRYETLKEIIHCFGKDYYQFARTRSTEWVIQDLTWNIDENIVPFVKYRREDDRIYVLADPDWIDSETGLPYPEGTELIYSDMNVKEGECFNTFQLDGNVVTRMEKKVRALTTALYGNSKRLPQLCFVMRKETLTEPCVM